MLIWAILRDEREEKMMGHRWTQMNTDKKRQKHWGQKNDERAWIVESFCPQSFCVKFRPVRLGAFA
jgi:hypothetical protein